MARWPNRVRHTDPGSHDRDRAALRPNGYNTGPQTSLGNRCEEGAANAGSRPDDRRYGDQLECGHCHVQSQRLPANRPVLPNTRHH